MYTETVCRGSVYVSGFSVADLVDKLGSELQRQSVTTVVDQLRRLGLLISAGPPDRHVMPAIVRLVAK